MKDWSRRNVLRAGAGAAVAVPMAVLGGGVARASDGADHVAGHPDPADLGLARVSGVPDSGPVMFCVHDAGRGEVSILHGTDEVIVTDRRLVARILQAAGPTQA